MKPPHRDAGPSRRTFLTSAAAAGALAWIPAFRVSPASAQATSGAPPNFPSSISLYQQAYQNWAGMIVIDNVWTCAPASPSEVVTLALVDTGLVFDGVWDIWGQSQNVLLYVKPSTVRIVEAGFAVITSRASVQQVVSDFYTQYSSRLSYYQRLGQYPMNGPVEIRVTGPAAWARPANPAVAPATSAPPVGPGGRRRPTLHARRAGPCLFCPEWGYGAHAKWDAGRGRLAAWPKPSHQRRCYITPPRS